MRLGSFPKFWAGPGDEARKYAQFVFIQNVLKEA